jgi:two-component system, sensor histidine kinase and response regulator
MKKRYLTILFIFVFWQNSFAQRTAIEEILRQLPQMKEDSTKLDTLIEITFKFTYLKPDSAIFYAQKAEQLAKILGDKRREALAINRKGGSYRSKGDLANALRYYKESLDIAESIRNKNLIARNIESIGMIYSAMGNSQSALTYYQKSLSLFEQLKNYERLSINFSNIGVAYANMGKYDSAEFFLEKALPLAEKYSHETQSFLWLDLSEIKWKTKQYSTAQTCLKKSVFFAEKFSNMRNLSKTHRVWAEIQREQGELTAAIENAQKAVKIAEESQIKQVMYEAYEIYSKILEEKGDFKNALKYKNLFVIYKDSVQSQTIENSLQIFEYERKQSEVAVLQREKALEKSEKENQRNLFVGFVLFFIIALIGLVYIIWQKQQTNKELTIQKNEILHKNEEIEAQSLHLQELNQVKDRLFSIISHDLRSPMSQLESILSLIESNNMSDAELRFFLPEINKNIRYTTDITNNLLYWAKSQMQGITFNPEVIDLYEITNYKINLFGIAAGRKELILKNDVPKDTKIFADRNMIDLILRNLVSNAVKFCQKGNSITIKSQVSDNKLLVSVVDTGVGIPAENLSKLFGNENFTTRGTANEKGTGLGLTLCKDFVEKNGGTIWVESELGKGSAFHFTVPMGK